MTQPARDWLLVSEHFTAPQGEGPFMGRPAYWTRLGGCNLGCTWCDAEYTWCFDDRHVEMHDLHKKYDPRVELHRESVQEIVGKMLAQPLRRYAITGGEPLLQLNGVSRVISDVNEMTEDAHFEIETAGTIHPGELSIYENVWFNVSPKLESSGNPLEKRRVPSALSKLSHLPSCFKFVIDTRDSAQAAKDIAEAYEIAMSLDLSGGRVWLMPCGITVDEVTSGMRALEPIVNSYGWNLSSRLQVLMHGAERGF